MDETYRLKIKIGQHEFEAEGPAEIVQKQFQAFKDLIASFPAFTAPMPQPSAPQPSGDSVQVLNTPVISNLNEIEVNKIMKVEERIVSLTVRPKTAESAVLLILYGQKILRANEMCTGGDVMAGIVATGGMYVLRVDRLLDKLGRDGDVIVTGEHRSKKYRLTNSGIAKVRLIAGELLATVS